PQAVLAYLARYTHRVTSAPEPVEDRPGPGHLFSRLPNCRHTRVDANRISQVPRRSVLCLCPGPRPRPDRRSRGQWRYRRCCPRSNDSEGSSKKNHIEANHAASAPAAYASRATLPPPPQGSLPAGWLAFAGRESNPLDRYERFQLMSSPFPGLTLTLHPALHASCLAERLPWHSPLRPVGELPHEGRDADTSGRADPPVGAGARPGKARDAHRCCDICRT